MPRLIDLRSDTVTLPTDDMREAIAKAVVGDDVYGEDPSVNALESQAARILAKESALFVSSGTMANLLAILTHCPRGRKVLVGDRSDIWKWEAGGASALGGVVYHPVSTLPNGELSIGDLEAALGNASDAQCAPPALICLEDTHCLCGGRILSLDYLRDVSHFAKRHSLCTHLDGARIFNAAVAMGVDVQCITQSAETVSICLSKGLSAPVGSVLAGSHSFISSARRLRKMIGGGMRQAGVLAAAGLYALRHMVDRLIEDHANARLLAQGLARIPGVRMEQELPETNIVMWGLSDRSLSLEDLLALLQEENVRVLELEKGTIRAVTHRGIEAEDIRLAVAAVSRAVSRCHAQVA